jgi:hypothetical protein
MALTVESTSSYSGLPAQPLREPSAARNSSTVSIDGQFGSTERVWNEHVIDLGIHAYAPLTEEEPFVTQLTTP